MSAVSDRVTAICQPYFGPATSSFLARQCKSHLKIEVSDLTQAQCKELSKWIGVGAGLLMDQAKATEVAEKVARL
jgi:hypothetical protein